MNCDYEKTEDTQSPAKAAGRILILDCGYHSLRASEVARALADMPHVEIIKQPDIHGLYGNVGKALPYSTYESLMVTSDLIHASKIQYNEADNEVAWLKHCLKLWYHIKLGYRQPNKRVTKKRISLKYRFKEDVIDCQEVKGEYLKIFEVDKAYNIFRNSDICDRVIKTMMTTEADFRNRDWYYLVAQTIKRGRAGLPNTAYNSTKLQILHDSYMIP